MHSGRMPPISRRLGQRRARAVIELAADFNVPAAQIARETGIGVWAVRAVLRGQTYRSVSRGFPVAVHGGLAADELDAILDRRLELIANVRRYREARRAQAAARRARR